MNAPHSTAAGRRPGRWRCARCPLRRSRRSTVRRSRRPARRRSCACRRGRRPRWPTAPSLFVSEKHDLPLVSFSLTLLGGADQFEPANRRGVASTHGVDAQRGHDDARRRGAVERAATARHLRQRAASAASRARWASCRRPASSPPTLDILADMLLHSTFPAPALERIRAQRLVALTARRRSRARSPAGCFRRSSTAPAHPFGQLVDRGDAEGHHARRRRGVPQGVLPAGPGGDRRRRRRHAGRGEGRRWRRRWRPGRPAAASRPSPTRRCPPSGRRRSTWWTSRARRSPPSRSALRARRGARPTTTRSR